jgi:predicted ArsR family transcriptional regulator
MKKNRSKSTDDPDIVGRSGQARNAASPGRFAYDGLDRILHEKARLGILTSLVAHPRGLSFGDLKETCSLTDGNLNRHLCVLADERLVDIDRRTGRGRPCTLVQLTDVGRRRFQEYLNVLEQVVADVAEAQRKSAEIAKAASRLGLSGT